MEHKFNVELAKIYGIEEAILIDNIFFWIKKNVANGRHFHDGRFWTYNTAKAYSLLFPYMNETKIYRVINHLCNVDLIQKGKYNEDKSVHTHWYAFTNNGLKILLKLGYDVAGLSDTFQNDDIDFANLQKGTCKNANSILINNTDINTDSKVKEEDTKVSPKKEQKDDIFEKCWLAYKRKGSKKKAKEYWNKLDDVEKENVLPHIKAYVGSRELRYIKDFERYIRDKVFLTVVYQGNQIIYDPTKLGKGESAQKVYMPCGNFSIMWDDPLQAYMYIGYYYDGYDIADGYTDENRPNGAILVLNNARGTIKWNSLTKKWIKL